LRGDGVQEPDVAGLRLTPQYRRIEFELDSGNGLIDQRIAGPPRDATRAVLDSPAPRRSHDIVLVPAGSVSEWQALRRSTNQPPGAIGKRLRPVAVDMDEMIHHAMLGAVERRVKCREVGFERLEVPPVDGGAVVGIYVGGEDSIEQIPALRIDGEPYRLMTWMIEPTSSLAIAIAPGTYMRARQAYAARFYLLGFVPVDVAARRPVVQAVFLARIDLSGLVVVSHVLVEARSKRRIAAPEPPWTSYVSPQDKIDRAIRVPR